ncbi:MAG: murein biosynthesis integral membrane protein MurJ [Alphaproteobacteria bacterium]|nr:murein biosynthesis integral membrane protein MurJ [Alphaproteobacteria bacterium]
MSKPIRLMRAFFTVGGWTLISRLSGFVRDIMIAGFLGAGPVAEAFLIAFSLPNMFRRFFAEGAFNMAFVPMFSKKLQAGDEPLDFARDALSGLIALLIVLTLLAQVFMPWLVLAMASGFEGDARFGLAVAFGRITFPYILFISMAALLSGALNAMGKFWVAAAAPVSLNILFIGSLAGADYFGFNIGRALVWTVPVAGLVQLLIVWRAADKAGLRLIPRIPRLTPDLRRLAVIAAPAALAGGVLQINLLVGRQVASFFDGAIAWLNYADRLYQLPLGVVGIAIGVVLLPDLSRKLQAADESGGREAVNRAAEFSLALTIPAAVALMVIPLPLVSVLFMRGAFGADDATMTAQALAIYGAGLPAFVLQKVLQPLYFARADTKRPFYFALVGMIINAGLAIGLAGSIGFLAAAIGTTLAGWAMVILLWIGARNMGNAAKIDTRLARATPRIIAASAIMGAALWFGADVLNTALATSGLRYGALAILVTGGLVIYGAAALLLGAISRASLKGALKR